MKIKKESVQKFVLLGIGCVVVLYVYFSLLLGPVSDKEAKMNKEIASLEGKIKDAKAKINRKNAIETGDPNGPAAEKIYKVMQSKIPSGSPVAWFSTRILSFFKQQNIAVKIGRTLPDPSAPEFPGYKTFSCTVDISDVGYNALGLAVAGLENQEGLAEITNLQIDGDPKDPGNNNAQLTISTLSKH